MEARLEDAAGGRRLVSLLADVARLSVHAQRLHPTLPTDLVSLPHLRLDNCPHYVTLTHG